MYSLLWNFPKDVFQENKEYYRYQSLLCEKALRLMKNKSVDCILVYINLDNGISWIALIKEFPTEVRGYFKDCLTMSRAEEIK